MTKLLKDEKYESNSKDIYENYRIIEINTEAQIFFDYYLEKFLSLPCMKVK